MNSSDLSLIITEDGSHSLYNSVLNETYHSKYGALQESQYVYINHGLLPLIPIKRELSIFEFGFGTGSNLFLTMHAILDSEIKVIYETVENAPLSSFIYNQLNYPKLLPNAIIANAFLLSHQSSWAQSIQLMDNLAFVKYATDFEHFAPQRSYDLIYFDAFAPSKQPNVWTESLLERIFNMMNPNAVLVTYCANSSFKKKLKHLGFSLEKLKGPPHKMEMTRATKIS